MEWVLEGSLGTFLTTGIHPTQALPEVQRCSGSWVLSPSVQRAGSPGHSSAGTIPGSSSAGDLQSQ